MYIEPYRRFVYTSRASGRLHDTVHFNLKKQVTIFLYMISFNLRNQNARFYSKRPGETIIRYFNDVLDTVIDMKDEFIKSPSSNTPQ